MGCPRRTARGCSPPNDRLGSEAVLRLSTFFENAAIHGEMRLVDCTGLALRLFQQRRRWNRRMINEDAKISHTFRAQREAPGRTGEPNSSAPGTAYAEQAAIFRLAPVPHARSTLLIPLGDLLVVGIGHANLFLASCRNARLRRRQSPGLKRLALRIVCRHYTGRPCAAA